MIFDVYRLSNTKKQFCKKNFEVIPIPRGDLESFKKPSHVVLTRGGDNPAGKSIDCQNIEVIKNCYYYLSNY